MNKSHAIAALLLLVTVPLSNCGDSQQKRTSNQSIVLLCERADDVAVRFWYLPRDTDNTPGPLILLPTSSQDPRLDTRPNWILYVSLSNLHNVVRVLAQSNLEWKESGSPQTLVVDGLQLPQVGHTMEIAISYPNGSATARVQEERVCGMLSDVYDGLLSPAARESMAFWTGNVDCVMKPYRQAPSSNKVSRQLLINAAVSMGRRNTQLRPTWIENKG
jgi:hypothetical protein